ncbi:YdcF family protein [Nocardia sp. CC227C]|uniref:YdcF family protein n=1 Tax=Nocardia sp. CC227C TaxID=3044562 RepID=UPI00278C3015|nr:YdcF family protein [Nocardia sp. CC227C]
MAALVVAAAVLTSAPGAAAEQVRLPTAYGPRTALVVLGYGLLPDGTMRPPLIERLRAAYIGALLSPASPIVVTGGNPRAGVSEADAMAAWLRERGLRPDRIHLEPRAGSTVENAAFTAAVLTALGSRDAVLITSADHLPRAVRLFLAAGVAIADTYTPERLPTVLRVIPL